MVGGKAGGQKNMEFSRIKDFFFTSRYVVGVDLGASALKAVVLESKGDSRPNLAGAYIVPYREDSRGNGLDSNDRERCTIALKTFMDRVLMVLPSRRKIISFSLDSRSSMLQSFRLENDIGSLSERSFRTKIEEWIPGISADLVVDFDRLPREGLDPLPSKTSEIVVAITKKDALGHILDLCSAASITPNIIEPEWSTYLNLLLLSCASSNDIRPHSIPKILLDVGLDSCKIIVIGGTNLIATSFIDFYPDDVGINHVDQGYNLMEPRDLVSETFGGKDGLHDRQDEGRRKFHDSIMECITPRLKEVIGHIPDGEEYEIYLTGGLCEDESLCRRINEMSGQICVHLNPFAFVNQNSSVNGDDYRQCRGRFSVCMGLALRAC